MSDSSLDADVEEVLSVGLSTLAQYKSTMDDRDAFNHKKLIAYLEDGTSVESDQIQMISCKNVSYVWNEEAYKYQKLCGIDQKQKHSQFYNYKGLSKLEQSLREVTYGKNVTLVPEQTLLSLLLLEVLTPFYFFQIFTLIVWFAEGYYYYTIAIVAMSLFGITSSIIQTHRNQLTLRELHSVDKITVRRENGELEEISSCSLVPGDVIEIPKTSSVMQCDAVLLNGICVVNESMLTGESVPVTKTPIPKMDDFYDVKKDCFHTLYCGTKIIQTQNVGGDKVFAVVLRTGFLTTKGELVQSILYPAPSDFKFDQDSYKFIGILSVIALAGFLYTVISKTDRSIAARDIILKALDIITIVVPPALPAAMTVGKLYALNRLKQYKIFCMNSRVINVSGSVDCICFDKTGTLTEDGLEMWGVVPSNGLSLDGPVTKMEEISPTSVLIKGMATCHSIVVLDNELLGDPLDIKVFQSTGYLLEGSNLVKFVTSEEDNKQQTQLEICHRFQFSSALQRMSVIVKHANMSNFEVFCKGSPEMISALSKSNTVPTNLSEKLKDYTEKGYRVIAMASKVLSDDTSIQDIKRADVEKDLSFSGLIILENCLKPETSGVIHDLRKANLKTIMITGDNFLTAVSVSKECGIISNSEVVVEVQVKSSESNKFSLVFSVNNVQNINATAFKKMDIDLENGNCIDYRFAITGQNWSLVHQHFPEKISELLQRGIVFARMSGEQKQQLIQELQKIGYYVAMCGDGANDCGALKTAHVGISLSEEESSIASPFTSKVTNITCVPNIIKEGRAALATSIGVFKYMVCYSLTQFSSVIVLYGIDSNLTQIQFLFIDLCLTLNFISIFGKTKAYNGPLHKRRPLTSLLCFASLASITLQMLFMVLSQVFIYKIVQTFSWFVPFKYDPQIDSYTSYENYAVFSFSTFQYIILAISFSIGKPFRMPIYSNKLFLSSLILTTILCLYIVIYPADWILTLLQMMLPPSFDFLIVLIIVVGANLLCSLFVENVLLGTVINSNLWNNIIKHIIPSKKCFSSKRELQVSFNLVHHENSKEAYISENDRHKVLDKSGCDYVNVAYSGIQNRTD